eukprot:gene1094-2648_t
MEPKDSVEDNIYLKRRTQKKFCCHGAITKKPEVLPEHKVDAPADVVEQWDLIESLTPFDCAVYWEHSASWCMKCWELEVKDWPHGRDGFLRPRPAGGPPTPLPEGTLAPTAISLQCPFRKKEKSNSWSDGGWDEYDDFSAMQVMNVHAQPPSKMKEYANDLSKAVGATRSAARPRTKAVAVVRLRIALPAPPVNPLLQKSPFIEMGQAQARAKFDMGPEQCEKKVGVAEHWGRKYVARVARGGIVYEYPDGLVNVVLATRNKYHTTPPDDGDDRGSGPFKMTMEGIRLQVRPHVRQAKESAAYAEALAPAR